MKSLLLVCLLLVGAARADELTVAFVGGRALSARPNGALEAPLKDQGIAGRGSASPTTTRPAS